MPPSLSQTERSNPPPRRKSCAACIKAKRRCDLGQPSCSRCSQRMLECTYASHVEVSSQKACSTASSAVNTSSHIPPQASTSAPTVEVTPWDDGFDFNSIILSPSQQISCSSGPNQLFNEPTVEPVVEEFRPLSQDFNLNVHTPRPTVPDSRMPLILRGRGPGMASFTRIQLLRASAELVEKRFRYTVDALKLVPERAACQGGGTPWAHPRVYHDSMPGFLEDAIAACSLYANLSSTNEMMVQRFLETRYDRLLSAATPTSARELLARTQALLLYQIMLFFSLSHGARVLAHETLPALEDTAVLLAQYVQDEDDELEDTISTQSPRTLPLYPLTQAQAFFEDWALQESIRRTMLMALFFAQMQRLMCADMTAESLFQPTAESPRSDKHPDEQSLEAINRVLSETGSAKTTACDDRMMLCKGLTLSAHLWNARDPVTFALAWNDGNHLYAKPWNIWQKFHIAKVDDVDTLGKILMSAGMGMDEARGWFASKGHPRGLEIQI
ncbi:hypothetical protein F5Y18DRAFT_261298 [Xylariaceae sp. FL1019]|nr:hypothetical protein F5Y18DRAFT_261298 [Xylariaceae sp. FL1019]